MSRASVAPLADGHGVGLFTAASHIFDRVRDWSGWQYAADYMWNHLWLDQLLLLILGVWALRAVSRLARIPGQRRRARTAYAARLSQTRGSVSTPSWTPFSDPDPAEPTVDPAAHPWAS